MRYDQKHKRIYLEEKDFFYQKVKAIDHLKITNDKAEIYFSADNLGKVINDIVLNKKNTYNYVQRIISFISPNLLSIFI